MARIELFYLLFHLMYGGADAFVCTQRAIINRRSSCHTPPGRTSIITTTTTRPKFLSSSISNTPDNIKKDEQEDVDNAMPWSDFQKWALRDNLKKYLISIPNDETETDRPYALWRTMLRDITELSGYDVRFVRKMYARQDSSAMAPGVLPQLDNFQFETEGGLSGKVYGLPGIADGSFIQTPPLLNLEDTVPRGYVRTASGNVAYELGSPNGSADEEYWSGGRNQRMALLKSFSDTASSMVKDGAVVMTSGEGVADSDLLLKLGGVSAILLAGAEVVNAFGHHLTVNVFWV